MKYFTIKELTHSVTAEFYGIDNTPSDEAVASLTYLVDNLLDPIREKWGSPINVTSGYRCAKLNKKVGGSATSQHMKGEAVDISTGDKYLNSQLFDIIRNSELEYDQLIDEKNYSWIHVSLKRSGNRNQILRIK